MTLVDAQVSRRFEQKKQSWTGTGRSGIYLDDGKDSYYVVIVGPMNIDRQPFVTRIAMLAPMGPIKIGCHAATDEGDSVFS